MGRVGYDDLVSVLLSIAAMILLYATNRCEFSLCSGDWLQGNLIHAGTYFEHFLHFIED